MGKSNATVGTATTKNNAVETPKFNIANAESVVAVKGLMGRIDNYGNVVLTLPAATVPCWDEDEETGIPMLTKVSTYSFPISRAIAVLCKEPGFQGYYEDLKDKRDEDSAIASTDTLMKAFTETSGKVSQELSNSLVSNVQQLTARRKTNRMYNGLLQNVVFDGILIPLKAGESVTYRDGYEKTADGNEVGFDFSVRLSPALREKLALYATPAQADTDSWQ